MARFQKFKEFMFLPLRIIFDHKRVSHWSLTSLRDERINIILKECKGTVLDVGCGEGNILVKRWGDGVGVDVYPWKGVDKVCDTTHLPFDDESFDTATLVAVINHIPEREKVLSDIFRVLKSGGRLLVTCINPFVGLLRHRLAWWDKDSSERGMKKGEAYGLWDKDIKRLLEKSGFRYVKKKTFVYGLNKLYIGEKPFNDS